MFHYVRKCTADRLRELAGPRRLATLTCFLRQSYRDTIDQAVDMFDKIIIRMQADTARELDEQNPIEWENVILYGQYVLNPDDIH
jgi:hypothetical protein